MGGQNEEAYLEIINTNGRNLSIMHTHRRIGRAKAVIEPSPNTTGSNEADTSADTCFLSQTLSPLHTQTGRNMSTHIVRRMILLKFCVLFLGIHLTITRMGILTSQYFVSLSIMVHR